MSVKPGQKLSSAVCNGEVMVIKAGNVSSLTCGGAEMVPSGQSGNSAEADPSQMDGCQVGKRYVNEDQSLELLCVKAGEGTLAADGQALQTKETKKLPSSD